MSFPKRDILSDEDKKAEAARSSSWPWTRWLLLLILSSCTLERRRQRLLTALPQIFCQGTAQNDVLCSLMSSILLRSLRPSLFIGTRSYLNSAVAYAKPGPVCSDRFREIMTMDGDGARIGIDWELPKFICSHDDTVPFVVNNDVREDFPEGNSQKLPNKNDVLLGPIGRPVILILHGANTDASFGYIRSIMKACTDNDWIAAGMNFRGCGGVELTTPRMSTIAYTNDIRGVVLKIAARLSSGVSLFLVGFSLGANILVKYLGEEGWAQSLPPCVAGAVSLGNPLKIDYSKLKAPWSQLFAIGAKKSLLKHYSQLRQMTCVNYKKALRIALFRSSTLEKMMTHLSPYMIRHSSSHPFQTLIGYRTLTDLCEDGSSYKYISQVTVPLLIVAASDDSLVHEKTIESLDRCLANPHVVVVQTKTGGHLGWHFAPRNNPFGSCSFKSDCQSWGDLVTAKFIKALLSSSSRLTKADQRNMQGCEVEKNTNQTFTTTASNIRARL